MAIFDRVEGLIDSIGEAGLQAMFPNDFQYYLIALELVTSNGSLIDYLSFPINPENIQQTEPQITNIKKTAGGISSLSTTTFVPKEILLKGTFGSKFKILFKNNRNVGFSAFKFSGVKTKEDLQNTASSLKKLAFDPILKNGYGCMKMLQSICDKSTMIGDDGKPFKLYFYNPIMGNNYLVKVLDFTSSMSKEQNRLMYYNLRLKAIAPLESMKSFDTNSMVMNLNISNLQKGTNLVASNIKKSLGL
jgi:hypothetical protein